METVVVTRSKTFTVAIIVTLALGVLLAAYTGIKIMQTSELMRAIKFKGCVADGLLTGYGNDTANTIALLERSQCVYLHRAIETWTTPPDFAKIQNIKNRIHKSFVYGMFIAEAIGKDSEYFYTEENRPFNFEKMCRPGSDGMWGEKTCKANFSSEEYRKYVRYITRQAIDLGIQSFLFGQIFFQDPASPSTQYAGPIIAEMRNYALLRGKTIIIGAQTNSITDTAYLQLFDYIEGGVGMNEKGDIENRPCSSFLGGCWALLWHNTFSSRAKNVVLHLDWSGLVYDDMSKFARMNQQQRIDTLQDLYTFFTEKNMGFLLPFFAVLYDKNGGCYGPSPGFYSPDNHYSCRDEDALNAIFLDGSGVNSAQFVSQNVPLLMNAGKQYPVSITIRNSGTSSWSKGRDFALGGQNPQDAIFWGRRIQFEDGERIAPGTEKTFSFIVTAPEIGGTYNFQWQMVQEGREWFGEKTDNLFIIVAP